MSGGLDEDPTLIARDVLNRLGQACGDARAFGELFTEDADLVHGNGGHDAGRTAIAATMGRVFAGPFKGTEPAFNLLAARALGHDAVLVRAAMKINGAAQARPPMLSLIALVRDDGAWRIIAYQNTVVIAG